MRLKDFQEAFKNGLLKGEAGCISVLENGLSPQERFYVHYNGLRGGLFTILKDCYPCTHSLVGEELFTTLSNDYIHAFWPQSPYLCDYGKNFDAFIQSYVPAVVYQTAALEGALQDSLLSYPSGQPSLSHLKELDPQLMPQLTFSFGESLRFFESDYDLKRVWDDRRAYVDLPLKNNQKHFYCIFSQHNFAFFHELSAAEFLFVQSMHQGKTLEEAHTDACHAEYDFNLHPILEFLIQKQLLRSFKVVMS